ncbi:hypothetical protein B4109_2776 [Geobacillus stearothermophilus]|uniref:Uncharacterized protein n=1 Tax=Geobacillus stearothermophilus TaxID=1422 RepID=A0A150MIL0_GEOSE|nr:hypothetical protein B4109_2776 [Geobacillus stearothermophilus]
MWAFLAPSGGTNHVILIANIKDMSSVSRRILFGPTAV